MLGQLDEADEEKVEVRLLSDPAFCEEFDIVVDEISIRYVAGGFEGDEKDRVERYFLRAPERQKKIKVMCELLHQSKIARSEQQVESKTPAPVTPAPVTTEPGFFARVRSFWNAEPLMFRFVVTAAAIVIAVGIVFLIRSRPPGSTNFATLALASSDAERGQPSGATEIKSVKLSGGVDELRLQLLLIASPARPATYRAELIPSSASRNVTVLSHDAQSVVIAVAASDLKPDRYAIHLFAVYPDGREERIPGSYMFRVE